MILSYFPLDAATILLTSTTSSQNTQLPGNPESNRLRIINLAANVVYVTMASDSTGTVAVPTSTPSNVVAIPAGADVTFNNSPSKNFLAYIASTAGGTLIISRA